MMDWTDRHYRYFARLISRHALLYTEMVTTGAILHGDRARYLGYDVAEQPLALQLGGSNPQELAECAALAEAAGYAEVNLNVGCPSDRVQNNMIGACLMAHPELVADCVRAMRDARAVPVTVKHRIGINGRDSYEQLSDFVSTVHAAGCTSFTVHARIAILEGLSPKENREIPPLKYEVVHQLKQDFPQLEIILNGGLTDLAVMQAELAHVDGVMVGREACWPMSIKYCSTTHTRTRPACRSWHRCARISSSIWRPAVRCITSPAICSACSRACRVRGIFAAS
jgi:tRNA-dihydrouridine synthase A